MRRSVGGGNLPPGAASDPNAPFNQPDPPECPECGHMVGQEGADAEEEHADGCEQAHMDVVDLAEHYAEEAERGFRDADAVREERGP